MFKNHPEVIALGVLTLLFCGGPLARPELPAPTDLRIRNLMLPVGPERLLEIPSPDCFADILREAVRSARGR